ncbi:rab9 effector protein with kelch motifs isoform X2 [Ctenopharyngodon idella]|uniref:rab9 effector protein with kelch motifs isoform X2 n=1 Tax=Ctenopharyngodon idella TaxID=7959 RepID=UPI002230DCD5|nr:rab9 effector protein with kelch motifs isoform X2 [Ctenopharyngodon idella]
MELLPILDPEEKARDRQWYVVVATGAAPGVSVGHTCTFLPSSDGGKGRIVVVGGANPNGSFSDSYMINLDSHKWEIPEWAGLQARYEHCSFVPESDPQSLWVFAGAEKSGNRNCVQVLRMSDGLWKTVQVKGSPPTVRTYHTNSACVGNRLYVFSGGDAGAAPVTDPQVHVFDSETMKWEKVKAKGEIPPGVAAHSSVSFGKNIFIFGGMTSEGASNSMYKFQCEKQRWTRLKFEGDLPPGRLDHSMCLVPWRVKTAGRETCDADVQHLCFIFGGMDTQGVIFNDCLVTLLT